MDMYIIMETMYIINLYTYESIIPNKAHLTKAQLQTKLTLRGHNSKQSSPYKNTTPSKSHQDRLAIENLS